MESRGFSYCCGLAEMGHFPDEAPPDFVKSVKALAAGAMTFTGGAAGAVIATTVREQRSAIRALRANGFKALTRFRNPNTGSFVTLWFKNMHRPQDW